MSESSKYQEQLNRVKRWYDRFKEINTGKIHDRESDSYQDEVYAFFMKCYHLKDWIKNDIKISDMAERVESFIAGNEALSLCADICNGIKHLKLTKPRSGQNPRFGQRQFSVELGGQPTKISVKYTINTNTGPRDAFELATQCIEAWDNFIKSEIRKDS